MVFYRYQLFLTLMLNETRKVSKFSGHNSTLDFSIPSLGYKGTFLNLKCFFLLTNIKDVKILFRFIQIKVIIIHRTM